MNLYVCIDHDHHWPVGVASVVVAATEQEARVLLDAELAERGLKPHTQEPYTLTAVDPTKPAAIILSDGNY